MHQITCENENETREFAKKIASALRGAGSIGLVGTLGAGKTFFAKALIEALGGRSENVASPTFTICMEHETSSLRVYHVDLYRVSDEDELLELGPEQWLDGDGIGVIEWADRFDWIQSACDVVIDIHVESASARKFAIAHSGSEFFDESAL